MACWLHFMSSNPISESAAPVPQWINKFMLWHWTRVVLEDTSDGSIPVSNPVCRHDLNQHIFGLVCLQKREIPVETQVSRFVSRGIEIPSYWKILGCYVFVNFNLCIWALFILYRIAQKREEAVSREVMKKVADDKRMPKKEKDER